MVSKSTSELITKLLKELGVTLIEEDSLKKEAEIGKGGFGKVYRCKYGESLVAMKELFLSNEEKPECVTEISNEINFIQKAQHEKLPKFYGVMISKSNHLNLIFEYIKGDTLKDMLEKFDDKQKFSSVMQLCEILEFLHNKKLIHRDIKPANIMIEDGNNVRLIDFGISKIASKTQTFTKSAIGTTAYMAPECFDVDVEMDPTNDKPIAISGKLDLWAVGTLVSELFSGGILPWSKKCKNVMSIEIQLVKKKAFPIPEEVTNELAIKIIKACTVIDPSERASASDIIKMIKESM
jgi:serine/threonine protein kinase